MSNNFTAEASALQATFSSMLELLPDAAIIVDPSSTIVAMNEQMRQLFGYGDDLLGRPVDVLIPAQHVAGHAQKVAAFFSQSQSRPMNANLNLRAVRCDGQEFPVDIAVKHLSGEHGRFALAAIRDISLRLVLEDHLRYLANHDTLTGLKNRVCVTEHLLAALQSARRVTGPRHAALFMDLNRFKFINDSLGHQVGDQLLIAVARRLSSFFEGRFDCAPQLSATMARVGGDEFVVLLEGVSSAQQTALLIDRMQEALHAPLQLGAHEMQVKVSTGIVYDFAKYSNPQDVIRDADIAMYKAKTNKDDQPVLFDDAMRREVMDRMTLETDLRGALDAGQFFLVYQPIVSLESGMLQGFEALIRWNHPQLGLISPDRFIPLAEETGMIVPIGRWVLRTVCEQLTKWLTRFPHNTSLYITINLSKRQLFDPELLSHTATTIREFGIAALHIKLEITESVVMLSAGAAASTLQSLREMGIQLCMDDFGTGQSSLSYLHRFPIDVLKIDRAFVANLDLGRQYAAIIHAIVTLAHNLNMVVIAEGVETGEQICALQALECDCVQGYHVARPMMADAAEEFIVHHSMPALRNDIDAEGPLRRSA